MDYTIEDLNRLIEEHIDGVTPEALPLVHMLASTPSGRERVANRVRTIITSEGIKSVSTCMAMIESELSFSKD